ncbi:MAG: chemotaxis protein CheB [Candidatus Dormibacteria bacterium]
MRAAYDIVVIASSAGGVTALGHLVEQLAPDLPAAVIAVQHLDPRHSSLLGEILGRRTTLPVRSASDRTRVQPGTIYVAPPDYHVLVTGDGVMHLNQAELVHFLRPSADLLFESAAAGFKDRAIAVVLSGTGSDGAGGVRAIKATGGTVLVQDDADFTGMPEAALATGMADYHLPLTELGIAINRLVIGAQPE